MENTESTAPDPRYLEAIHEYEAAIDRGRPLNVEEWIQRYPEVEPALLRDYVQNRKGVDQFLGGTANGRRRPEFVNLQSFSHYSVIDLIGWGGTASIHCLQDSRFGRQAAIKVPLKHLANDERTLARLKREAKLSGRLQHPGIVPVYDVGTTDTDSGQVPYFTMRYVQGESLAKLLEQRVSPQHDQFRFIYMFRQICQAVAYAHNEGIIHCDLKPENVKVGYFDDPYVLDWGFARDCRDQKLNPCPQILPLDQVLASDGASGADPALTVAMPPWYADSEFAGEILGTPCYLAPEVAKFGVGVADKSSDVFCLGGILCRILTGTPTFSGFRDDASRCSQDGNLDDTYARLEKSAADPELITLAKDCLAVDRSKRPSDANEVANRVTEYIRGQEEAKLKAEKQRADEATRRADAERVAASEAQGRARAEKRLRRFSIATGIILVIVVAVGFLWQQQALQDDRRDELFESGLRAYTYGNHAEAREQLDAAIRMDPERIRYQIIRLRASFSAEPRSALIHRAESLLAMAKEPDDKAKLQFILGDLLSCEKDRLDEGRSLLELAAATSTNSPADREYAEAVIADSMQESEKYLAAAIAFEPFHHRANVVRTAVQLSLGKISHARSNAIMLKRSFSDDPVLELVLETCNALTEADHVLRIPDGAYRDRLTELLGAYTSDLNDSAQPGMEQLTFARQAVVAESSGMVLDELPVATSYPGLPVTIFALRAKTWKARAAIAAKLAAPQNPLELLFSLTVDRTKLIEELEKSAEDEPDGIALQVLATAKFVELSKNYNTWDAAKKKQEFQAIKALESRCIESETLVPRSQFEMASRVLRILSDYELSRGHGDVDQTRERRMHEDIEYVFSHGDAHKEFLGSVGGVFSEVFVGFSLEKLPLNNSDDLQLGLRVLSDWIAVDPENLTARGFRARLWHELGRDNDALKEIELILKISPDDKTALKLRETIEGGEKNRVE